ncbi:hypothetical protein FQA47_021582 [Oryzias melastigma]|uniref:Uncharacterized protein n=1 Tax=Oryzias melastigma TaxID=30732 RepID=A0A834BY19_ORYME|nr:hypothetical protein FQA47_021582 [Oryzias melastigma]
MYSVFITHFTLFYVIFHIFCACKAKRKTRVENQLSSRMRGRLRPLTAFCKTLLPSLSQQHLLRAEVPEEELLLKMHMLYALVTAPQEASAAPQQQTHSTGGLQLETFSWVTCSPSANRYAANE